LRISGASKAAAKRLISDIIKIKDSLSVIELMMNDRRSSVARSTSNKIFDIFENLDDMNTAYKRLKALLEGNVRLLTGHDSAAAALIQEVVEDEMQCLVFKCRAHLMRIHSKVQQAKFAAVPYERRISQSKPGNFNLTGLLRFSYFFQCRCQTNAKNGVWSCKTCTHDQANGDAVQFLGADSQEES
jgi:hypothetical protein